MPEVQLLLGAAGRCGTSTCGGIGVMFVPSDDVLLNVVQWGSEEYPAFVAHGGWAGRWEVWQEPFQLMQARWRCVSYDHRGAGASTATPAQITPHALVDDLI